MYPNNQIIELREFRSTLLSDLSNMSEVFEEIVTAWKTGDLKALSDLFIDEIKADFPKLYKAAIVDRNMAWLPKIAKYLDTPETEFVLVGAAHLVGEDGVIEQLKKLGYKIEKLK